MDAITTIPPGYREMPYLDLPNGQRCPVTAKASPPVSRLRDAREALDRARQAHLFALYNSIVAGVPVVELHSDVLATTNAMRGLLELGAAA
jgi:hypothetical protein